MEINRRCFVGMVAGVGLAGGARAQGKTVEVSMKNQPQAAFEPASVRIAVGDTVEWTNPELITHTVTFEKGLPEGVSAFGSGDLEQDGTYKHTFTVKGEYPYFCKYHEKMGMAGTVVVA